MVPAKVVSTVVSPRVAGALCVTAAILLILSQVVRLGVGYWLGPDAALGPAHTLTYALALLATCALLLALTAIYARVAAAVGVLGLVGYVLALLGTVLAAGDWWFEAFVVPALARAAPDVLTAAPAGSVLAGVVTTVGLFTIGWTLFGLALLRARSIPRAAVVLTIIAGLAGPLSLSVPYLIPLAVAVGWIGLSISRGQDDSRTGRANATTVSR
jgi:hypothetical protein